MSRVYLFKRFERFWHWSQAALVLFMLLTGFEIHGKPAGAVMTVDFRLAGQPMPRPSSVEGFGMMWK